MRHVTLRSSASSWNGCGGCGESLGDAGCCVAVALVLARVGSDVYPKSVDETSDRSFAGRPEMNGRVLSVMRMLGPANGEE